MNDPTLSKEPAEEPLTKSKLGMAIGRGEDLVIGLLKTCLFVGAILFAAMLAVGVLHIPSLAT